MKELRYLLFISSFLLLGAPAKLIAQQQSEWFRPFSWQAFISQSMIYSSDYDFLSRSDDDISLDMWEAGLLFSTTVKDSLSFSAQVLGRKVSESSGNDIRLDYGFFTYPLIQSAKNSLALRLGRIRSSYGFYNETRDIPHTRTGVVMPQAVYFDMTRNSFYSADGLELFGTQELSAGQLAFQLFISRPVVDKGELQEASQLSPSRFKGNQSMLAKIEYGAAFNGWRAAFTYYKPEYDVSIKIPASEVPLTIIDEPNAAFSSENLLTSLEYNQLQWSLTLEYLRHKFQTTIPALDMNAVKDHYEEAYYVQGIFRFDEYWQIFSRFEQSKLRGSRDPRTFFDDATIGFVYRPNNHWLLRTEVHYIEGYSRLLKRDNEIDPSQDPYWTAAMFQIAYKW